MREFNNAINPREDYAPSFAADLMPVRSTRVKSVSRIAPGKIGGATNLRTGEVSIPVAESAEGRTIRLHEAMHATHTNRKCVPADMLDQALEDARLHRYKSKTVALATEMGIRGPRRDELAVCVRELLRIRRTPVDMWNESVSLALMRATGILYADKDVNLRHFNLLESLLNKLGKYATVEYFDALTILADSDGDNNTPIWERARAAVKKYFKRDFTPEMPKSESLTVGAPDGSEAPHGEESDESESSAPSKPSSDSSESASLSTSKSTPSAEGTPGRGTTESEEGDASDEVPADAEGTTEGECEGDCESECDTPELSEELSEDEKEAIDDLCEDLVDSDHAETDTKATEEKLASEFSDTSTDLSEVTRKAHEETEMAPLVKAPIVPKKRKKPSADSDEYTADLAPACDAATFASMSKEFPHKLYIRRLDMAINRVKLSLGRKAPLAVMAGSRINSGRLAAAFTTPGTRVFSRNINNGGHGTILIDASGSMSIPEQTLIKFLEDAPALTLAFYNAPNDKARHGNIFIYAANGYRASAKNLKSTPRYGTGNVIDYHAMAWLIKQPAPHYLVCDRRFTGRWRNVAQVLCDKLLVSKQIILVPNLDAMRDIIRERAKGKRAY